MVRQRFWRSEMLFLAAYSLWLVFAAFRLTYLRSILPITQYRDLAVDFSMILLALKFFVDGDLSPKTVAGLVIIGLFSVILRHTEADQPLYMLLFLCSMRNVDYKKVFRTSIVIQAFVMAATVLSARYGVIKNDNWEMAGRIRYDWGYTFCTYGAHIAMFMSLVYMSIKRTLKTWQAVLLLGFNYLWYLGTNTNTDLILFLFSVVGCYLISISRFGFASGKFRKICFMLAGPVIAGVSITAQYLYDDSSNYWIMANDFVNGRLGLGHQGLMDYPLTLWGQKIRWVGAGSVKKHPDLIYNYVDCSYLKYLLNYGIVFEILLLLGIVLLGKYVADQQNPGLQMAFLCWLIFGAIDAELFNLDFQPILLLLGYAFSNRTHAEAEGASSVLQLSRVGG